MDADTSYIKITHLNGMVNIDSPDISYCNIKGMYSKGRGDGTGIQLSESAQCNRHEIFRLCNDISRLLYSLDKQLKRKERKG